MLHIDFTSQGFFRKAVRPTSSRATRAVCRCPRFVRRDVTLGGVALKQGDQIMAMLTAANRDPAANDHPDMLDLTRRPNRHMAFGTGIHFCLGHQLARIEGRCALKALFARWPRLALAVDPLQIRWRPRLSLRAIEALPVGSGG